MDIDKDALLQSMTTDNGSTTTSAAVTGVTLEDMQSAITLLVDKVLQVQEYRSIDAETYELLRKRLEGSAEDYANAAMIRALSDEEQVEFMAMLDSSTQQDLELYLRDHIPDIHKVIYGGLKAFCAAYLVGETNGI